MAKYLDSTGISTLWGKCKSTFLSQGGGAVSGAIKRLYGSASNDPVLNIASVDQDIWIWRVSDSTYATESRYGFGLKYLGTGGGNANALGLYSDDCTGAQIQVFYLTQDGIMQFNKQVKFVNTSGAPFTVNSSTVVSNLNADLLDGYNASDFATSAHDHDNKYLKLSGGIITGALETTGEKLKATNQTYNTSISLFSSQNVGIWNENTSAWILKYDGSWLYRNDKKIWDEGSFNPSNYSLTSHSHDSTYLKLTGGTLENYGEILTLSNTAGGDSFLRFSRNGNTSWSIGVSSGNFYFKENVTNTNFVVFRESSQGLSADFAGQVKSTGFVKSGGTSSQFLKADGSIDSTTYFSSSNDGSGSGLDADLLDGHHGSEYIYDYGDGGYTSTTDMALMDPGIYGCGGNGGTINPMPETFGCYINLSRKVLYRPQLFMSYNATALWIRSRIWDGTVTDWNRIAFFSDLPTKSSWNYDDVYSKLNHTHSGYAASNHNHDSVYVRLDGSNIMTSNLNIKFANTDKFVVFSYAGEINPSTDSWRVGVLGTGSGEANYFTVQYQVVNSGSNTWKTAFNIGQSTGNVSFTNNISVAGYTNLHTGNHTSLSNSEIDTIMV